MRQARPEPRCWVHPMRVAQTIAIHARTQPRRFSRIFDGLPSFAEATPAVRAALTEMGAPGGLMDAQDPLHLGPIELITKPELSPNNRDNPTHTAGITFLGQFIDHDMTFDTASWLGVATAPERSPNGRTPSLDLDSVYGRGSIEDPQLYDPADRVKLKVESSGAFEDRPARGRWNGDTRRPPQRRARYHRGPSGRVPDVPQRGHRHAPR